VPQSKLPGADDVIRARVLGDLGIRAQRPRVGADTGVRQSNLQGMTMPAQLNHLIVYARDSQASANFLARILGLAAPTRFGPFHVVATANGVSMDFIEADAEIASQHYAFLISEAEFDEVFGRIRGMQLPFWADPGKRQPQEINHGDGGRGVYFEDPDGHFLEILTRPYGSASKGTER